MALRLFLVYAVVELAAVVALVSTIGFGWTILLLLGTFVLGLAVAGSQINRHIRRLRRGFDNPHGAIADSALVALGAVLVFVPGVVSTALGLLLLLPPTRAAARPLVTMLAARRAPLITIATVGASHYRSDRDDRGDYIDGEVIDVTDVEPQPLPRQPD
jgi:UPF0716 protein FxsA